MACAWVEPQKLLNGLNVPTTTCSNLLLQCSYIAANISTHVSASTYKLLQMPTDSYTPDQAAAMVGTSPTSIRNWCKDFAGHLSTEANPQPGQKRRLTQQDVAKLQQVKLWRNNGRSTDEIATLLHLAATANGPARLTIDVVPTPPTTAQEARSDDLLLPVALSNMQSQINATGDAVAAMQRQIDALARRADAQDREAIWWARLEGAALALIAGAFLLFLLWLSVNGAPW
jgi:DNA-binding transcriptional MerR regulator